MSRTTVDAWGSFARTFDPNPSPEYLAARGYNATAEAMKKAGRWEPVGETPTPLRILDVTLRNVAWLEEEQCEVLGYPITKFFD